jgi:hypothetical protein
LLHHLHAAETLADADFSAVVYAHTGRVIPTILQALEALDENVAGFLGADVTDNSTHVLLSLSRFHKYYIGNVRLEVLFGQ